MSANAIAKVHECNKRLIWMDVVRHEQAEIGTTSAVFLCFGRFRFLAAALASFDSALRCRLETFSPSFFQAARVRFSSFRIRVSSFFSLFFSAAALFFHAGLGFLVPTSRAHSPPLRGGRRTETTSENYKTSTIPLPNISVPRAWSRDSCRGTSREDTLAAVSEKRQGRTKGRRTSASSRLIQRA